MDADLRPQRADESLGELIREATQQASTLLRDEVALARTEIKEDVREAVAGLAMFSAAGVLALLAVLMLSAAAAFGIGRALGEEWAWAGFVVVGLLYLVGAGVAGLMGKKKAQEIPPPAPRTTKQLKETAAAVKGVQL
jgi:hypothetical protein